MTRRVEPPTPTVALLALALVSSVCLLKPVIPRKRHRQSSTDLWASCGGRKWGFRGSATDFVHLILYTVEKSLNDENLNMQSFISYIILSNLIRNQLIKVNSTNISLYSQTDELRNKCKINELYDKST